MDLRQFDQYRWIWQSVKIVLSGRKRGKGNYYIRMEAMLPTCPHTWANPFTCTLKNCPPHLRNNTDTHLPPVLVKLSVPKVEQLSGEVHRRVEERVEKHQPQQVIRNLEKNPTELFYPVSVCLSLSKLSKCVILERHIRIYIYFLSSQLIAGVSQSS